MTARNDIRLIEEMKRAEFYPERPAGVDFKQTHMSWVFVAGDLVFKVKKPVHFAFADACTLSARYSLCCEELRLNRRLARDIYLEVVPIIEREGRCVIGAENDILHPEVREYAVRMRRLPDDRMLDGLVRSRKVTEDMMGLIARRLAGFHREASSASGWRYGSAVAVERMMIGNLEECRRFIGNTIDRDSFDTMVEYLSGFIRAHRDLINDRAREGRVREGHGDLRCEHVCMNQAIDIFDCVEFDERLRYGDFACDLAFLAMDLDSLKAPHIADDLIREYGTESQDQDLATLVTFYKCYRACVRGKVGSLKSIEQEVPASERQAASVEAREKFDLAARYARCGSLSLLVVCGLTGTGKSTVAEILRNRTGFEIFNSDRTRKRLAGVSETAHGKHEYRSGIYAPEFDRLTYDTMVEEARIRLMKGRGAILDATYQKMEYRRAVAELANEMHVPVLFVECRLDEKEALRRLAERSQSGMGASDATPEIYQHQKREFSLIDELGEDQHLVIDTAQSVESLTPRLEEQIALHSRRQDS
jgi:aminoglycoside phosphotransferase family enzyme/predicted kinase